MTNAELIAALRYCVNDEIQECDECPFDKSYMCREVQTTAAADALEAAEKRIAELEAQLPKEGEWVSVKDRLPTEKGAYLTAYYDGFVCENEWHFIGETAVGWVNDCEAVRYWMKLPEPPNCGAKRHNGETIE